MIEFKLPEVGENIESGNVVAIHVAVGDTVTKDQPLMEIETDKASLDVPSPCNGVIKEVLVNAGDDVAIGAPIFKIEEGEASAAEATSAPEKPKAEAPKETPAPAPAAPAPQPAAQAVVAEPQTPEVNPADINVVVLGGGPGGYTAAFMAADLGMNVTLVNEEDNPGGVCLYRGCIPSKALLHAAKVMADAREAAEFGISFGEPKLDLDKLREWKDKVVNQMTGGLGVLSKQRKITYVHGKGSFKDSNTIVVEGSGEEVKFDYCILATGSRPIFIPDWPQSDRIIDSTKALELEDIPKSMLLVGGGVIGLELGTVYAELGTEVECVEMLPGILPGADRDIVAVFQKSLKKILKDIMVNTKVTAMEEVDGGIKVSFEDKDGKTFDRTYKKVLVAIGRRPNSENIGLENTKVVVTDRGFVEADIYQKTADPSIFAIGDLIGQPMLAHKASHEGIVAAEVIAGHKAAFEPKTIPAVVYTDPEIAWCGLTETEAKEKGINVTVSKFPWAASGRAVTMLRTEGLTKLIIDPDTDRVLGVSIVGPNAGELIAEGVVAIEMGALAQDLKMCIHPHPTLSETLMESAEGYFGKSTHIYRPKKK